MELLISTHGGEIYRKRLRELLPLINDQFASMGGTAVRAIPLMGSEFKAAVGAALAAYKPKLQAMLAKNPWGVPVSMGTWGGSGGMTGFATEMYFLHEAFPDSIGPEHTLAALDYVLGRHPVSNTSYVSTVGTQSKLIAYGNNRADHTFVPGGIIPGVVIIQPDFPELKKRGPSCGTKMSMSSTGYLLSSWRRMPLTPRRRAPSKQTAPVEASHFLGGDLI